jgi:hypothetical protein
MHLIRFEKKHAFSISQTKLLHGKIHFISYRYYFQHYLYCAAMPHSLSGRCYEPSRIARLNSTSENHAPDAVIYVENQLFEIFMLSLFTNMKYV